MNFSSDADLCVYDRDLSMCIQILRADMQVSVDIREIYQCAYEHQQQYRSFFIQHRPVSVYSNVYRYTGIFS